MSSTDNNSTAPSKRDITASHIVRHWTHTAPLMGCRYDPTGRYVFASSIDCSLQRWDLQTDTHVTFSGHDSWLRGIGFSSSGQQLYSAGYEGKLCFWDAQSNLEEGKVVLPTREISAHDGWIRSLAVHPDGELLATGGNDLKIKLWSTTTGELVQTLEGHQKHIYSLLFHPAGNALLSGDLEGVVQQWELPSGKPVRRLDAKLLHTYHAGQRVDYGGVRSLALSTDLKQLACGGLHKATNPFAGVQEPLVVVFDWESGKQLRTHETTDIPRGIVWRLLYETDGTMIGGIGGRSGYLAFWQTEKTDYHKLEMPDTVLDLDRHPTQPELVTANHDGAIHIVRMAAKT